MALTPEEQNYVDWRKRLVSDIYHQELGIAAPDEAGLNYWAGQGQLDEGGLREWISKAGKGSGPSGIGKQVSEDPRLAAFLRGQRLDENEINSSLQAARSLAKQRIEAQRPAYDLQRKQATSNVNREAESRGMFRSGGRLKSLNDRRSSIDLGQRQFESNVQTGLADTERSAASDIARLRRNRADEEAASRSRIAQGVR